MTTDEFLNTLDASNLIPSGTVAKIRQRVAQTPGVDARRCAKGLVDKGLLSPWQARQLLAGRNAFYLGRYRLLDRIGKGGMGMVFKAQHAVMERTVALKVMSHQLLKNPRAVARFNREVKAAAALHHPNIITAFDADAVGNTHFLVMEYVDGQDLNQWLKVNGPLPVAAACECAMQAAEGLSHAVHQGMVHRDIKPVNLVVTWNSETERPIVKILDMGLARFVSEVREGGGVTRAGQTIGTPDYIAPEAAQNFKKADIRADIFSLGCSLYKLLTGRLPFGGENTMEKLLSRTTHDAPPVRALRPEVPPGLEEVLAKMLARDPAERYQHPSEVSAALAPFAASTAGHPEELSIFRVLAPSNRSVVSERIDAEPDSSLEEFLQDFSVSPLRDEAGGSTAEVHPPSGDGVGFELVDEDSLDVGGPSRLVPPPRKGSPRQARGAPAAEPVAAQVPGPPPVPTQLGALDDNLFAGAGLADAAPVAAATGPDPWAAPTKSTTRKPKPPKATWDSFLFLGGGGLLISLLILVPVLWWLINRETGDQALEAAQTDYRNGAYTQAINKYNQYLLNHDGHPGNGTARVQRGVAQVWQAVQGGGDWARNLKLTVDTLKQVEAEREFGEARAELAGPLPRIAEGLANQAREEKKSELIEEARTALALIDRYVPKTSRPTTKMQEIESSLALTEQTLRRDSALAEAVAGIDDALAKQESDRAYELRREVVKSYPDTETDPSLIDAMVRVTAAQKAAVMVRSEGRPAETSDPESPILRTVLLAPRAGQSAGTAQGLVITALAAGAAYGIDGAQGEVLWRRPVGLDSTIVPVPLESTPGADLLVVDRVRGEVARLAGRTGKLQWRQAIDGVVADAPTVIGGRLWVPTQGGQLARLDPASGELVDVISVPQQIEVAPAADSRGNVVYQFASHSNLYLLGPDGQCLDVLYTGQSQGSIRSRPIVFQGPDFNYLIWAENRGLHDATLRVFSAGPEGNSLTPTQELRLEGHLTQPPTIDGRLLNLVTDRGAISTFELGPPDKGPALTAIISQPAEGPDHYPRFALVRGTRYFIADRQLTRYNLRAAAGRIEPLGRTNRGDEFLQPLVFSGDALVHVRRAAGRPGVTVAAVRADDGAAIWETHLGTPPLGSPVWHPADGSLWSWNQAGELLIATPGEPGTQTVATSSPVSFPPLPAEDRDWGPVAGTDFLALAVGPDRQTVALWRQGNPRMHTLTLPGALACPPAALGGSLVCLLRSGQVARFQADSGQPLGAPFQPQLEAGQQVDWARPAVTAQGELVVCDGPHLVRLAAEEQPVPQLVQQAATDLNTPVRSPLAAVGGVVYGVDESQTLCAFNLADLEKGESIRLDAPLAWGPETVGQQVLVATDDRQLLCLGPDQALRWKASLADGALAGPPREEGDHLWVVTNAGTVTRLGREDGQEVGKLTLGQPVSGWALGDAGKLWIQTLDGALVEVAAP